MRKLLFLILFFPLPLLAQSISATATITDSDSQTWNNGTWSVQLVSSSLSPTYNGTAVSTALQTGSLNSSGALSVTLYNTSTIAPSGAQYRWTLCSETPAPCSIFLTSVTSSNLSTLLSGLVTAPRFPASPIAFGYLDAEITPTPPPGGQYFNVTNSLTRQWTGSAWQNAAAAGGGSVTSVTVTGANGIGVSGSPITSSGTIALSLGDISGATIDNTVIGGTTPAAVTGTTVTGTTFVQGSTTLHPTVRGTLTMTTATSDAATVTGATTSSICTFSPTNSTAAATTVLAYISAVSANSVTVSHAATVASGGTLNIVCTVN